MPLGWIVPEEVDVSPPRFGLSGEAWLWRLKLSGPNRPSSRAARAPDADEFGFFLRGLHRRRARLQWERPGCALCARYRRGSRLRTSGKAPEPRRRLPARHASRPPGARCARRDRARRRRMPGGRGEVACGGVVVFFGAPCSWTNGQNLFDIQTADLTGLDKLSAVLVPAWHNCRGRHHGPVRRDAPV